jgi:hypothetical protein
MSHGSQAATSLCLLTTLVQGRNSHDCDPLLVLPYLPQFKVVNPEARATRSRKKTEVTYYTTEAELAANSDTWGVEAVRCLATVSTASAAGPTLGVATGGLDTVKEQLVQKVKVVKAMQQRTAVCCDTQTEHVLNSQSLGIGRVNHFFRVHGHRLARDSAELQAFDDAARCTADRLFPGLTDEFHKQAALSVRLGGLGWRRATEVALPAALAALVAAAPKVRSMAAAEKAGLAGGPGRQALGGAPARHYDSFSFHIGRPRTREG